MNPNKKAGRSGLKNPNGRRNNPYVPMQPQTNSQIAKRQRLSKRRLKVELVREKRLILWQRFSNQTGSRKHCLGYELGLFNPAFSKVEHAWFYEAEEERWARAGLATLLDAQARQILAERAQWKPYKGNRCAHTGPESNVDHPPLSLPSAGTTFEPEGFGKREATK